MNFNCLTGKLPIRTSGLTVGLTLLVLASAACTGRAQEPGPQQVLNRAIANFEAGQIDASVSGFDEVIRLAPNFAPQLWQRGIALYYASRWEDCRRQFELHRTVNPNDVENAVWHYICVARLTSPEEAQRMLLPVGPDPRIPMTEIYEMFRGSLSPEEVLASAVSPTSEFYANLYVGLFYEAQGDAEQALAHIRLAAQDDQAAGNYMHMVARVHQALMTR